MSTSRRVRRLPALLCLAVLAACRAPARGEAAPPRATAPARAAAPAAGDPTAALEGVWAIVAYESWIPLHLELGQGAILVVNMRLDIRGRDASMDGHPVARIEPDGGRWRLVALDSWKWLGGTLTRSGADLVVQLDQVDADGAVRGTIRLTLVRDETAREWRSICFSTDSKTAMRGARCPDGWQTVTGLRAAGAPAPE